MVAKAERTGLPEDTQAARDFSAQIDRFEKKIYDLELTKTISLQMAPQIRLIQTNDTAMSEKIQSTLVNTIPLWKSQMVIAIGLNHSTNAAKAQKEVSDMTNALLKKNAETLKIAQELYDKKLTTYPRTDARVLSTAVAKEIDKNLSGLAKGPVLPQYAAGVLSHGSHKGLEKTKYVNDKQITDHYAIIPTGQGLQNLQGLCGGLAAGF